MVDIHDNDIIKLREKLSSLTEEYGSLLKNPKINRRQLQVLGSKITKVNYSIGNRLMELSNDIESLKR